MFWKILWVEKHSFSRLRTGTTWLQISKSQRPRFTTCILGLPLSGLRSWPASCCIIHLMYLKPRTIEDWTRRYGLAWMTDLIETEWTLLYHRVQWCIYCTCKLGRQARLHTGVSLHSHKNSSIIFCFEAVSIFYVCGVFSSSGKRDSFHNCTLS